MYLQPGNELAFGFLMAALLAILGVCLIQLTRNHREQMTLQIKLFLISLAVRFLFSIITYEFGLIKILGDEDGSGWVLGAYNMDRWARLRLGFLDLPSILSAAFYEQNLGYHYMLGGLFFLTGTAGRMPAAALNCFFGALTVVFTYRIAKTMFSQWTAVRAGWAACFFPSLIIWSAQTVKEPVVILLEAVALYACAHLKLEGFSLRYCLLCGAAILLLLPFRFYAAYLAAAAAMIALIIPQLGKGRSTYQAGFLIALLVVPLALSSGILARSQATIEKFDINRIHQFRTDIAKGTGSGVASNYDLRTPLGLTLGVTVGAAHLFLAPFPWQLQAGSLRMLGTLPELVVWWWLFFFGMIPGAWYAIKNKFHVMQPFLFFVVGLGLLYSMMFGNVGLIVRQRAQLMPWFLIIAMVGLEQRAIRKLLKKGAKVQSPAFTRVETGVAR